MLDPVIIGDACIGIEMDPEYFAIAVERIKQVSPDGFTLESQS